MNTVIAEGVYVCTRILETYLLDTGVVGGRFVGFIFWTISKFNRMFLQDGPGMVLLLNKKRLRK